jgi:hypothetical protein
MTVSVGNIRLYAKAVNMVRTGADIETRLPRIGMPMPICSSRNSPESMTVPSVLGDEQIRQIAKSMPMPICQRGQTLHAVPELHGPPVSSSLPDFRHYHQPFQKGW